MLKTTIALIAATLAIWAMVDVARNRMEPQLKAVWFATVVLIPIIGPVLYFLMKRQHSTN